MSRATSAATTNCYGCVHFYITWDKQWPYGCRKMDFRSKRLPSEAVLEADGQPCLAREERPAQVASGQIDRGGLGEEATNRTGKDSNQGGTAAKVKASRVGGKFNLSV
ncbi:hypothetical protein N9Q44_03705 [Gammaproteobacteria bacterium]|nr:hypothetical protein [Gammaproteobacteria bacterium]